MTLLRLSLLQVSNESNTMLKVQTDITHQQGMAKAMDELNAVLMFFQGITRQEVVNRKEKVRTCK